MRKFFQRHIAITNEHGSWVFLFSPLLIGLFAGRSWSAASLYLTIAALAAFLGRQPIIIAVKAYSGRRSRRDLSAAWFWIAIYGSIALLMVAGLIMSGFSYVLYLVLPGIPVFIWHLYLVSQRAERRQQGIEVVASGVLALTAPAVYWIGINDSSVTGWLLWMLTWLQSAASIIYAYLRLEQREWQDIPERATRFQAGRRAILYTSFNLVGVVLLSIVGILPPWLFLPYLLQWLESLWGTEYPAVGVRPTKIGLRQLFVSILFTVLFILTWNFQT